MSSKKDLRQQLRSHRQQLSSQQQKQASLDLCRQFLTLPLFINSQRIAVYLSNDGEVDLLPLINLAWSLQKTVYLPVLHPFHKGELVFMRYEPEQALALNRFGIPEPVTPKDTRTPSWMLDIVLTPLVGFDAQGNRMGMGGGFYDRTFAFLKQNIRPRKPTMIGVAHECQKAKGLMIESWDIPMDWIMTDKKIYKGNQEKNDTISES